MTADTAVQLLITFCYQRGSVARVPNAQYGTPISEPHHPKYCPVVATVVGRREDPEWYTKCLGSLKSNQHRALIVAGIDGDEVEDEQMVKIFQQVFPEGEILWLPVVLSEKMENFKRYWKLCDGEDADNQAMEYLLIFAQTEVEKLVCRSRKRPCIPYAICIIQPHRSKKDILFTSMVFGIFFAQLLGIEAIFSTDSDTIVHRDALDRVAEKIRSDAMIGGVSGHMRFFHAQPTLFSRLPSAYYWFQQDVAKIQGSMFGFNECQPGPCAGFRVKALKSVLASWMGQKVCGCKMVSNEDRHFTTKILAAGYRVVHVPDAMVETDTPNSFKGWIRQQVRWMRGTMIETTAYPAMHERMSIWVIYNMAKTRLVPLATFGVVGWTALAGQLPAWLGGGSQLVTHFVISSAMQIVYLLRFKPNRVGARWSDLEWTGPSLVWFFLWFPAIVLWSLLTVFNNSWGTPMRAASERVGNGDVMAEDSLSLRLRSFPWDMTFMYIWMLVLAVAGVRLGLNTLL